MSKRVKGKEKRGRVTPKPSNLGYGILGLYPSEIKEIKSIEKDDNRTVIVNLNYGKNQHKTERVIRVQQDYDHKSMVNYLNYLAKRSTAQITHIVKQDFEGLTPTQLRHNFATEQSILWGNSKKASKLAMGHNKTKNMGYYVDFIEIANREGIARAEELIQKTEHKMLYSMLRLAMRRELKDFFENIA